MDNTLDALRNLYVALGGNPTNVANITIIPDMINAIATNMMSMTLAVSASANLISGTTVKLAAVATRGSYYTTDSETGIVYYRGSSLNDIELTLWNVGVTPVEGGQEIKKSSKGTTASSINVGDNYGGIYYRGYIIARDESGKEYIAYSDVYFVHVVDGEIVSENV